MVTTLLLWCFYALMLAFSLFCIMSGLFILAEWIEEYTVLSKKIIRITIWFVLALHFLLLVFESQFAFWPSLSGILAHGAYIYLLREWPYVDLWSAGFAGTCVLLLLDHYLWFQAFTQYYIEFERVLAIFVLCVWLVPFMYLVSLSAPDSTLPYGIVSASGETDQDTYPLGVRGGGRRGKRTSQLLLALAWLRRKVEAYLPTNVTVLLKGGGGSNSQKLF